MTLPKSVVTSFLCVLSALTADAQSTRPSPIPVVQVFGPRDWHARPFRIAVVLVDFANVHHGDAHDRSFYEKLFLPSGSPAYAPGGSLADWYALQSSGHFALAGKVFDWVRIDETYEAVHTMKRRDAEDRYLRAALAKLRQRDGEHALDGFDGWFIVHAGPIGWPTTNVLWSHQSVLDGTRYFTTFETATNNVSCHEFGHMLGLPDLYDKPGVHHGIGPWCTMSYGYRGAQPGSLCAWSKARLGWCRPTVIDPATPQHLVLRPIQTHPDDALIIPLNAHDGVGAEFLMLENRADLLNDVGRQAGLLIWHINRTADQHGKPAFDLTLPGPDDRTPTTRPSDRRVAWPTATAHDYRLPPTGDLAGVTIRNIRRSGDDVAFEVAPQ
jgi:M6 family metalloprotease-like protein